MENMNFHSHQVGTTSQFSSAVGWCQKGTCEESMLSHQPGTRSPPQYCRWWISWGTRQYQWRPSGDLELSRLTTVMKTSFLRGQWMQSWELQFLPVPGSNEAVAPLLPKWYYRKLAKTSLKRSRISYHNTQNLKVSVKK